MFIYQRSASYFLVQPWPTSGAGHYRIFNGPKLKVDLSLIVEHVARALFETNRAFVRYSTFSLLNVSCPTANLSFGYRREPPPILLRNGSLFFTFAFTRRVNYPSIGRPRFMLRPIPEAVFWGYTLIGNSDFLTITVPKRVLREAGMLIPNLREMEWLYMSIGAFTKNFAQQFGFYRRQGLFYSKPLDANMAHSLYYHKRFQSVVKHVPYHLWAYSKDIWTLAPNILGPRVANTDFLRYYCLFLAKDFFGKYLTHNVEQIENAAVNYLIPGMVKLIYVVKGAPEPVNDRMYDDVMTLIAGNRNAIGLRSDPYALTRDLLAGNLGGSS